MTEEVKPDKIKKTQESLSKFIKKPPLTDKLLRKPPFRFLHDIVTSVMRETGVFEGLFTPDELNSENIKDRNGKINFLDKLIAYIKSITGSTVSAKPSKIIAGLEVNKTLDLLITLAKAVDIKKNGLKTNDKTNPSKAGETKESKKSSRNNKDDKNEVLKKKRDDSRGRDKDKKKVESKNKIPDKKKIDGNKKEHKSDLPSSNIGDDPQPTVETKESDTTENKNGVDDKNANENEGSPTERPPSLKERPPSHKERPPSHKERPPSHKERPPSHKERPPSHKEQLPQSDNHQSASDKKSAADRRSSSRQNSVEVPSESKSSSERSASSITKDLAESSFVGEERRFSTELKSKLPDKVPLEQVVQFSSDSVSNSNLSSDPSDKIINENNPPEINGDSPMLGTNEKPEKKVRISSVNSRMERYLSAKNEEKKDQLPIKALDKVDENNKAEEPEKSVKMKRPQSAKLKPGSSRQRRPGEDLKQGDDKVGQVVLGEGESTDVMGSAPISAPSAKGRRMLSGRPMSARPGAPKPKDRGQINNVETSSTSEEVKPVTLIEDKKETEEDDSENLVVVEKEAIKNDEDRVVDADENMNLDESNQGVLVAQILETKKELEDTKKGQWLPPYQQRTNVDIDWDARSRSRRDALTKEVQHLRDGIQTVTRSSNPLGKLFDFLQEDVELMQSELQDWTKTNAQMQKDIQLQSKQTDELLAPLQKQLADLDLLIEHEQESIRRIKSNIYLNSTKLETLLKVNSV